MSFLRWCGQQFGLERMGPAKAPRVFGPTAPYCASPPKVLPLRMFPNSQKHTPPTFALEKDVDKILAPFVGFRQPEPQFMSQTALQGLNGARIGRDRPSR